jgi:RNA polymerase sigma factor (TIGR02999 family)
MPPSPKPDLTTLLHAWRSGDGAAFSTLIDRVYDELKVMAAKRLAKFDGDITLSATDLMHEALLRVVPGGIDFKNRAHFFATMSLSIRALLIDHARARVANKRGGGLLRVTFTGTGRGGVQSDIANLLVIEQALNQLEQLDPRCGQVVHLSYFGGLEQQEIAELLGISVSSVTRDIRFARDWIARELRDEG